MKNKVIKRIILISILSAIASILYIFPKFSLHFFPSFLEINFSMLPIIICVFALGPIEGMISVIIRFIVKLITIGTHTVVVGEIADLIIGVFLALIVGFYYKKSNNKYKDTMSMVLCVFVWVFIGILLNWLFLVPTYIELYCKGNLDAFVGMCSIIPGINNANYMIKYILFAVIPFNALIAVTVSIVTYFVNKRIKIIYENR